MALPSSDKPLFGLWEPENHLKYLYYGTGCVEKQLLSVLPSPSSKVFIVTGNSIATKTTLIKHLKVLLADHIAGVFANVKQHVQAAGLDEATAMIKRCNPPADTILAVGGGSPIDFAKILSYRLLEKRDKPITLIAIPTTLSAAECTAGGGFTKADGTKTGFLSSSMGINAIFYDPDYAKYTPKKLWLGTGIRAIDHAVETMYHPYAVEFPRKTLSIWALETLFECLPKAQVSHPADKDLTTRLLLAAYASSAMKGSNVRGGPGLSHALGYALGSPYDIPHGETSCITLGEVVKFKAHNSHEDATQIARLLPATGGTPTGNDLEDAMEVGGRIIDLALQLGLQQTLSERGVSKNEIPTIVERATKLTEGREHSSVAVLVENFF